jgi:glucosamine--fructose-6-phosphate aminotransferase (isomerizing)
VLREIKTVSKHIDLKNKGNYQHYMLKEIFEQPSVIATCLNEHIDIDNNCFKMKPLPFNWRDIPKVTLVACGTSYYAAMVAKYWFENMAKIAVEVDIASEFRYRNISLPEKGVALFISQSGETADTLAALRYAKSLKQYCFSVVNVAESSMARESDVTMLTHAGVEIGVASTKAFTAQLITLAAIILYAAKERGHIDEQRLAELIKELAELPGKIDNLLNYDQMIKLMTKDLVNASSILYIGRGTSYAVALEGALKLKELSYIHAEALAAGELKHGTIALVDENMPIIVIAPKDHLFEKTCSNAQEIAARGGKIYSLSDKEGNKELGNIAVKTIDMLPADPFVYPILYTIPVQLIAYYTAYHKGYDIDQPRNLAKSVTVE